MNWPLCSFFIFNCTVKRTTDPHHLPAVQALAPMAREQHHTDLPCARAPRYLLKLPQKATALKWVLTLSGFLQPFEPKTDTLERLALNDLTNC